MKPRIVRRRLNYNYPASAYESYSQIVNTAEGFRSNDLSRNTRDWRSKNTKQTDIYVEISDPDQLDCFALINTNLSDKAKVYISGALTSGVGSFLNPIFTAQLSKKKDSSNWLLLNSETFPSCKYFRFTIIDNEPVASYFRISRIIAGISEEFPLNIVDGMTIERESYQKREIDNGQWTAGNSDSKLNVYSIPLDILDSTRDENNTEYDTYLDILNIFEELKSTIPFLLIVNPEKPTEIFDYVCFNEESLTFISSEAQQLQVDLSMKEMK